MTTIESLKESLRRCHGLSFDLDALDEALDELHEVRDALRYIRDCFDHDGDAHRYSTPCRVCTASRALGRKRSPRARRQEREGRMTPEQRREVEVLADGLCGAEDRRAREALWAVLAQVDALTRELAETKERGSKLIASVAQELEAAEQENARLKRALQYVALHADHLDLAKARARDCLSPSPAVPVEVAKEASPFDDGTECMHWERSFGNRSCMRCGHQFPKEEWAK